MLVQLGHWLRAAGYDTMIAAERSDDRALLVRAASDARVFLTRDRRLSALGDAMLLRSDRLPEQAAEITRPLRIDWLRLPFSRCLVCNVELRPAPSLARIRLPETVRATFAEINHCPQCDRLYWAGGHVRRMRQRLERWSAGDFA